MDNSTSHTQLDVRALPAPEPMVRILEATAALETGAVLKVIHNRVPTLLYPRLAERGLEVSTDEREDGIVELTIIRP